LKAQNAFAVGAFWGRGGKKYGKIGQGKEKREKKAEGLMRLRGGSLLLGAEKGCI